MSDSHVVVEKKGQVLIIKMNRPEKKNALTGDMYKAITGALIEADNSDDIRVAMICGHPEAFTAGNDLGDFLQRGFGDESPVMDLLRYFVKMEKPLVAAVSGTAVGIGVTMLMHCDLVYASENARMRLPFVNLGLVPEAASSLLMPAMMGRQRASELLLLGDFFDGHKAREYGIVNDVVADDALFEHALAKAEQLAAQPAEALKISKDLLTKTYRDEVEHRMGEEGMLFAQRLQSDEARQVLMAFMSGKK